MKPVWIVLILGLLTSGCSHNAAPTAPEPSTGIPHVDRAAKPSSERCKSFAYVESAARRGKIIYNVKYQPQTVVFDVAATEKALRGVSDDGSTYFLDSSQPAVRQLKPGSVLFLYGVALRKVTSLQTRGSE